MIDTRYSDWQKDGPISSLSEPMVISGEVAAELLEAIRDGEDPEIQDFLTH